MKTENWKEKMIEEIEIRNLDPKTMDAYLKSMEKFIEFHGRSPKDLKIPDIKKYQRYLLIEKKWKLSPNSVNRHLSAIRFYYRYVLGRHWYVDALPRVKAIKKMPTILSETEVAKMIDSVHKVLYKAVIMTLYSTGMRQAELRNLKITDIDSKRMVINIRNGKGGKDRQCFLSPLTLKCLRTYWRLCRVKCNVDSDWLFIPTKNSYNGVLKKSLSHTAVGYILDVATKASGIKKKSLLIA